MNLKINHRLGVVDVKYFNNFNLELKYDAIASTFSFDFYFDPANRQHAEMACVSHFHEAVVQHNGETLLTGYLLSQVFNSSSEKELSKFAGYSKAGVLEDCEIPPSLYPLQTDGLTLRQIAQKLIAPFKLKMIVDSSVGGGMDTPIPTTTCDAAQNIKSYLTELAAQRHIVMTHNEKGEIVFTKAKTNLKPLFHLEGNTIGTSMNLSFSGQQLHSHITVMRQADADTDNAGEYTISNPYVPIVYRPKVIIQTSGDTNSVQQVAENALAAELKSIVLTVNINRWDFNGKLIRPNTIISIKDPELFIYKATNFFIESVSYKGDAESNTAVLKCVLPEVYNGKTPKNIFVDPHQNLPRI